MAPASTGGPIGRICPLTEPNEAMALEAQMEAWFTYSDEHVLLLGRKRWGLNDEPKTGGARAGCARVRGGTFDAHPSSEQGGFGIDIAFYGRTRPRFGATSDKEAFGRA
jgi:hypothetical protein